MRGASQDVFSSICLSDNNISLFKLKAADYFMSEKTVQKENIKLSRASSLTTGLLKTKHGRMDGKWNRRGIHISWYIDERIVLEVKMKSALIKMKMSTHSH